MRRMVAVVVASVMTLDKVLGDHPGSIAERALLRLVLVLQVDGLRLHRNMVAPALLRMTDQRATMNTYSIVVQHVATSWG